MATEIELKVIVFNPDELRLKLSSLATLTGYYEKSDIYFTVPGGTETPETRSYGVRIRSEKIKKVNGTAEETAYVTYKYKEVCDGIEINDEHELTVSSVSAFEAFLYYLGCAVKLKKRKTGAAYKNREMTIELSEVETLGWYLELEILLPEKDSPEAEEAKKKLLDFLDLLEIPRDRIESRTYSELLLQN